jgi:hypothetical protein
VFYDKCSKLGMPFDRPGLWVRPHHFYC